MLNVVRLFEVDASRPRPYFTCYSERLVCGFWDIVFAVASRWRNAHPDRYRA